MDAPYYVFSAVETGNNHKKVGKVCEDYADKYQDADISMCVVADGHGSDNYPRTCHGSKFAAQAACECLREFCRDVSKEDLFGKQQEEVFRQLEISILNTWYGYVDEHLKKHPIQADELLKVSDKYKEAYMAGRKLEKAYGTTLIVFAVTKNYSLGIQIGDGTCVVLDENGDFSVPIPEDPNCQLNVTTSICDSDAINEFRYFISEKAPVAVVCGSDGVEDSYSSIDEVYALYRSIASIFAEHGPEVGSKEVSEYLPILTRKGSGDDVSVSGIIDMRRITPFKYIFGFQNELFKVNAEIDEKEHRTSLLRERLDKLHSLIEELNSCNSELADLKDNIKLLRTKKKELETKLKGAFDSLNRLQEPDIKKDLSEEIATRDSVSSVESKADPLTVPLSRDICSQNVPFPREERDGKSTDSSSLGDNPTEHLFGDEESLSPERTEARAEDTRNLDGEKTEFNSDTDMGDITDGSEENPETKTGNPE